MDALHQKMMSLGKVLEFRRHHEVALDYQGVTVCQTRAKVVFSSEVSRDTCMVAVRMILAEPVPDGFLRQHYSWEEPDWYGRPSVEVHYTDVEVVHGASGTEAA